MATEYIRSKKDFKTARSAWMDIANKSDVKLHRVGASHTATHWRWKKKQRVNSPF